MQTLKNKLSGHYFTRKVEFRYNRYGSEKSYAFIYAFYSQVVTGNFSY